MKNNYKLRESKYFGNNEIEFKLTDKELTLPFNMVGEFKLNNSIKLIKDGANNYWISYGDYIFEYIGEEELDLSYYSLL